MDINIEAIPYKKLGQINKTFVELIEGEFPDIKPPDFNNLDGVLEKRKKFYLEDSSRRKELINLFDAQKLSQNQKKNLDILAKPDSFVVIGGQQIGLLTGPLYTLYKIITILYISEKLNKKGKYKFVPVFWAATQDHDLAEVQNCHLIGTDNNHHKFEWNWNTKYPNFMSGSVPLEDELLKNLMVFCRENLRETEFRESILRVLENAFSNSNSAGEWFIDVLNKWFGDYGLLVFDSRWSENLSCTHSLLLKELNSPPKERISQLLMAGGKCFLAGGHKPPIHKLADISGFFICKNNKRYRVTFENDGYITDIGHFTKEELLKEIEKSNLSWNGNVALRPLVQDTLFPTAISVVGPTEYLYHGQLKVLYEKWNIPQPVVLPRISMTLIENKINRRLHKIGLQPEDFLKDITEIEKNMVKSTHGSGIENITKNLENEIEEAAKKLGEISKEIDPALLKAIEKQGGKLKQNVSDLNDLLIRKLRQNNDNLKTQLEIIKTSLFPMNSLQERSLNLVQFLCYYGTDFISELLKVPWDIDSKNHFWVNIES